jgi:hypothetical protein
MRFACDGYEWMVLCQNTERRNAKRQNAEWRNAEFGKNDWMPNKKTPNDKTPNAAECRMLNAKCQMPNFIVPTLPNLT